MSPVLLVLSLVALNAGPLEPKSIYSVPEPEFIAQAREDLDVLRVYAAGLRALDARLRSSTALRRSEASVYSPDEKEELLSAWGALFSYVVATEGIRQRYWGFVKVPPTDVRHAWGYLLTHLALTTELSHGLSFADRTTGRRQLEVLLDEPSAEYGLPPRAFARFKERVIHVATSTQLYTGDAYGPVARRLLERHRLGSDPSVKWAVRETQLNSQVARGKLRGRGAKLFVKNAADILEDASFQALFPVQRHVAEWMGDTRVRRQGRPLIRTEQVNELLARMEPGDILVARQNWFISNVGLPGFWPHAELFLGTPEELSAYFKPDSDELRAYLASLPGRPSSLADYLRRTFPAKWRAYEGKDYQGNGPIRVIESVSEGVSFTSLEHAMLVDYLGVMRPRLTRVEKARAIVRAFRYQGRPYDFNFDFFSDATLVCTELVWKSYARSATEKGIDVPLVKVAGRRTLPANELVKLFDRELDRPDRQLDFVGFLDGREELGAAVFSTAEAFRRSHARVKWDLMQL